ncbi:MAG: hypothetical protein ACTS53_01830 [Candidatus Hodgkinia cicadicola]
MLNRYGSLSEMLTLPRRPRKRWSSRWLLNLWVSQIGRTLVLSRFWIDLRN